MGSLPYVKKTLATIGALVLFWPTISRAQTASENRAAAKKQIEVAEELRKKGDTAGAIEAYRKATELDPDNGEAQFNYMWWRRIKKLDLGANRSQAETKRIVEETDRTHFEEYAAKAAKEPDRAVYQWMLGELQGLLQDHTAAEKYHRRALELDPKLAKAYQSLSLIEEFRGNNGSSLEYMKQASQADPEDPSYAFYYASKLQRVNLNEWRKKSLEVAAKWPNHERGAQALYWLGLKSEGAERRKYLEQLRAVYPPAKFSWSSSGMSALFEAYLWEQPAKALALAKELASALSSEAQKKSWQTSLDFARAVTDARNFADKEDWAEAAAALEKAKPPRLNSTVPFLMLKAEIAARRGEPAKSYETLLAALAGEPNEKVQAALLKYGAQLGKSATEIDAELWQQRDAKAKSAAELDLGLYTEDRKVKLADYKGKVLLVTFWYPACGPCRGEFPYFQSVLEKYQDKLAIVAPNVYPKEDAFVLPFIRNNRYGFIPVRTTDDWANKNYGARGYPTNALIDPDGKKVYFAPRAHDAESQRVMELQIEALLAKPQAK